MEGFLEELWEFQSTFHDCFARSEPRVHFFDYMVGQFSKLERKSIEPMALQVEGGTIRGLQRFISDSVWDEEQMRWNYHQLVAEEMGDPDGGFDHRVGHFQPLSILSGVLNSHVLSEWGCFHLGQELVEWPTPRSRPRKKLTMEALMFAFTPFNIDLQGLSGLACQF